MNGEFVPNVAFVLVLRVLVRDYFNFFLFCFVLFTCAQFCLLLLIPHNYAELNRLYDKYIPEMMLYVIEGVLDGKQSEKLKTIAPLTNLNLVGWWWW